VLECDLIDKVGSREPVAVCPFHDDRHPSLRVNLDRGVWFCDPCGTGGDLFDLAGQLWGTAFIAQTQPPRETVQVRAMSPERDALEIRFPRVEGYRVELPEERLTADFNEDSILELSPDLVGPSITRNAGIIGEGVDMSLEHMADMRPSTLVYNVTKRLLYTKWRDPGEEPKLYLFGQLKRITKQWLDECLVCKGETYPGLLMYQELADMACNRITAAITRKFVGVRPIKALLDPYNTTGSTKYVRFNTSRSERWDTNGPPPKNHVNWVVLDSDWEAEFCRVAESHPKVIAYTKNRNLGLEVPYRFGSETRRYLPDFIVLVDDGHSLNDPLHLVVEIKGYRREDAKENKSAMDTYWVPGVNHLGNYGRWAFAEFIEIYQIESDFAAKVASAFNEMLESVPEVRPLWIEESLNRSNEYISRHFGDDPALVRLNQAIWSSIGSNKDRAFRLSDLNSAEADSNETEEMLAILTLLSNPSIRLLKIQLRSDTGTELNTQEFTRKLTDWWRKKQIANEEWQRWATNIAVSWVAVESAVHNR
jgi:hypothetical protein